VLELEGSSVTEFAWEPNGRKFAIISSDNTVNFYAVDTSPRDLSTCRIVLPNPIKASRLYWSPLGNQIILAVNGALKFFNVNENI
ncbi:hypothetical protein COLO4_20541, partial [Corchorus olitorius]